MFDMSFDEHLGESFYNDRLAPLVAKLESAGLAEPSEGALCVFFRDVPALADKPALIRKSDGGFLYATTDIATIEYRIERWQPDEIWYVTGAPQTLHFEQVFAVARKLGVTAQLRFVPFGSILGADRKLMKTRSGDNVQLRDLLVEAQERALAIVQEKNPTLAAEDKARIAQLIGIGAIKICRSLASAPDGLRVLVGENAIVPRQHRALFAKRLRAHPVDLSKARRGMATSRGTLTHRARRAFPREEAPPIRRNRSASAR